MRTTKTNTLAPLTGGRGRYKRRVEELPISALQTDPVVNRTLDVKWVQKLAAGFDPVRLGTIVVSERSNGVFIILDGQHRVEAIRALGYADYMVTCYIISGLSVAEECNIFVGLQHRRQPQRLDIFFKNVTAGAPDAVAIDKIVRDHGLIVSWNPGDGKINAIAALESLYEADDPEVLAKTLDTVLATWGEDDKAFDGQILRGLGALYKHFNGQVDEASLASRLSKYGTPGKLIGAAKTERESWGGSVANNISALVVGIYNRGRSASRLANPWRK